MRGAGMTPSTIRARSAAARALLVALLATGEARAQQLPGAPPVSRVPS
jgi:hypothetical protein